MDKAILAGWLYVPLPAIGGRDRIQQMKERLTYLSRFRAEEGLPPIVLYSEEMPGYLGVPRAFGLERFPQLEVEDRTTLGNAISVPRRPDPNHPRVKDPEQQAAFMRNLAHAARQHRTFIGTAPTGSGKTVCACDLSAELGRQTLILVHLERLMDQWVDEIRSKLGVPEDQIGIVQSDRCEFRGRTHVVGMLHSLTQRRYDPEFYRSFGLVVFDEVHKVGSHFFAPVVPQFPAYYKVGLSATPTRKDGGDRVFVWHLGPIRVRSTATALPMKVYVIRYTTRMELFGNTHGAHVKCLTLDPARNAVIVRAIKRFYDHGRQALVVSDSVAHLQHLMDMAERAGVPRDVMGQFTGEVHTGNVREVDPATGRTRSRVKKVKRKAEDLADVKENAQIIFATYGMMTEGIDIPRLDAGIDATPRGDATQLIGRIRRPMPDKKEPVWITLYDTRCPMSRRYFTKRCRDYAASGNVEVVGYGTQEGSADRNGSSGAQGALVRA